MKRTTKKLSQLLVLALLTVMMCIGASAAGSVTGLKQTEWRDTSVSIQWDLYPGANRYAIYIGTTPDNCECDGRYSSETSDYITGLNPGSSYYVKIKAYKGWGSEAKEAEALGWSEPFQVSTLPAEPAEPANFKWLDSTATTVTLGWDPIANVSGYEVYRYISYDNEPVVADIPAGSTVAVVNQEKASSASYFVRAYVTGQNGTRVYSSFQCKRKYSSWQDINVAVRYYICMERS